MRVYEGLKTAEKSLVDHKSVLDKVDGELIICVLDHRFFL